MTYSDHDVSDLLGAYALDAVDQDEARRVEEHLANCAACQAEVATYRETAAMLAYAGTPAPDGIWARIGSEIHAGVAEPESIPSLDRRRIGRSAPRRRGIYAGLAAIAAAVVAVLGIEVGRLNSQVTTLQQAARTAGLAPLVAAVLDGPHENVSLTSSLSATTASIAIGRRGDAYWLGSTLKRLPSNRTYQVWGQADGRTVSLDLLGSSPDRLATFQVQSGTSRLMVTDEPRGGSSIPTTPVLIQGGVPATLS